MGRGRVFISRRKEEISAFAPSGLPAAGQSGKKASLASVHTGLWILPSLWTSDFTC